MITKNNYSKILMLKNVTLFTLFLSICFIFISCGNDSETEVVVQSPSNQVFKVVDEMPRFPGCEDTADKAERKECQQTKMLQFIYTNIKYPEEARESALEGVNVVQFIVEKDGSITNEKLVKSIGGGLDQECLRVVRMMPSWIPGLNNGVPVRVEFNLPIKFKLE